MSSFNIVYEKYGKYSAIVYPVSYINPIEDIDLITLELKKHYNDCYVLFDLLLSNGDNFNRFAEVYFDGESIDSNNIHVIKVSTIELNRLNRYYKGKTKELNKSVLTLKERYKFATVK